MEATRNTEFGLVSYSPDSVSINADHAQLYAWANRAGAVWPCSTLEDLDELACTFDASGLIELDIAPDDSADYVFADAISADEFNAWSSDVLREALPADHMAHFVTVAQFD